MEPLIVTIATPIASAEILNGFRSIFETIGGKSPEEQSVIDNQFHRFLAIATNNSYARPIAFSREFCCRSSTGAWGS